MGVSSEFWTQLTTYGSSGPAAPPPTQHIRLNDSRALAELNFADFHDPADESDCSAMLQAFLDYAGTLALALKSSTNLDDQNLRSVVRATLPRGNIAVANQIVVPEWVDLDMLGTLVRINGGSLSENLYLPVIVYVPTSIASRVNVYCNPDGVNMGSGVCFGKTWSVASLTISKVGTGYQVGDIITLTQPSKSWYQPAIVTVESIGPGGSISTFTLTDGGFYSRRPPTGPMVSAAAIQAVAPDVIALVQPAVLDQVSTTHADGSPGAGSGAAFTPDWGPDFVSGDLATGVWNYQAGLGRGNMLIGHVNVMGCGTDFSPEYGAMFAVMLNTFCAEVDTIQAGGGYYGIVAKAVDTRANALNPASSMVGMVVASAGSFECPNVVIDTAFLTSLYIHSTCEKVLLRGTLLWPEGNYDLGPGIGPHNSGYAIIVGADGAKTADDIRLDFSMSNSGSATQNGGAGSGALFLSNVQNSHFNIETSNRLAAIGGTYKLALHTGYGPNVDASSVLVSGTFDGTARPVVMPGATVGQYLEVTSGGTGYAVGDVVAVHSANRIIDAMAQVAVVFGGAATIVRQIGPGLFGTFPNAPLTTTAVKGSGSGLILSTTPNASPGMVSGGISIRDGSMPGWVRDFGICEIIGNDAPTAGTGANKAPRGSKYTSLSTGDLYLNKGTAAAPVWRKVTTA